MTKKQRIKKQVPPISTSEFDARFEAGESILPYTELDTATFRVNIDFPVWTVSELDRESTRLGVTRQALVKFWIAEKLDQLTQVRKGLGGHRPQSSRSGRKKAG